MVRMQKYLLFSTILFLPFSLFPSSSLQKIFSSYPLSPFFSPGIIFSLLSLFPPLLSYERELVVVGGCAAARQGGSRERVALPPTTRRRLGVVSFSSPPGAATADEEEEAARSGTAADDKEATRSRRLNPDPCLMSLSSPMRKRRPVAMAGSATVGATIA